ncbi:nuclear transport factor 2 family protein [Leifsonia sp. YIM 134122]|uniref:Nuclear transport factor 2 family protein n=1 Tax=Leifsonia stereocauli TaxID=3134136 RepID=A0ABU9W1E1_9MICO
MVTRIDELITACLYRVFGERDDTKRSSAIAEVFAEDAVFSDPRGVFVGRDAVNDRARILLEEAPRNGTYPGINRWRPG